MLVFTREWIEWLEKRYEHLPDRDKSYLYFVATTSRYEKDRAEIEASLQNFPDETVKKFVPKLQSPDNFFEACNELRVGYLLQKLGYEVEYERKIDGLTPDWFVFSKGDMPAFVVEVFTTNPSDNRDKDSKRWAYLLRSLREIKIGVALRIDVELSQKPPVQNEAAKIIRALRQWLAEKPSVGQEKFFKEYSLSFKVLGYNLVWTHVFYIGPATVEWVNPAPLGRKIEAKVEKYKTLKEHNMPVVIGIVPGLLSGLGKDDLETALLGAEATELFFSEEDEVVAYKNYRQDDRLLKSISDALSAILWVSDLYGGWKIDPVYNPNAANPLPPGTFGEPIS